MIKTLLPVNTNLESSIALRYAQGLSRWVDLVLHDMHVVESDRVGPAPGSGWIRHTWENALIETASQEIRQFLEMENLDIKGLGASEILIGDRTEKLLETLEEGKYQLFMEGVLPTFKLSNFYSLVHSRLYREMTCPALVVKNLVALDKVALIVGKQDYSALLTSFLDIFSGSGIEVDLIGFDPNLSSGETPQDLDVQPDWLHEAAGMLDGRGVMLVTRTMLGGPVQQAAQSLRSYGLVAAPLPKNPRRHDPHLELLARVRTPVLICWARSS